MDLSSVRRHHLSMALEHLVRQGPCSRAALAQQIGLTKATVSALVSDLLDRGLVEERSEQPGDEARVGRPAVAVGVRRTSVGALGLEITVEHVDACVVDLAGQVRIRHRQASTNRNVRPERVLERLRTVTQRALADAEHTGIRCTGGTLAVPGLVEPRSGELLVAPNLHWLDVDLTTLGTSLGLPDGVTVAVDNEANLAALAEMRHGCGQHLSSFVHVSGGTGVGAGIVIDRRVVRGTHGFAGELGHVVIDPAGRVCSCGARGCLETVVGAGRRTSKRNTAIALATALRSVVHLLDPDAVVLGGRFATMGSEFAEAVARQLHDITLGARWRPCEVYRSAIGPDAAIVGAATAALDVVLADPTVIPLRTPNRSA
jgi:predicted NBD/HSP70 family sugar kinase